MWMAFCIFVEGGMTMRTVGRPNRAADHLGGRRQILVALAILGTLCAGAAAQIRVEEPGLHDGESVYGLYVPAIPYVNWDDISLLAWGETNPDLYANVSFSAYGLYGEADTDNVGWIHVVATGGAADTDGLGIPADAQAVAFGVFAAQGALINDGYIDATAFGGKASSTLNAPMQNASAAAVAYGLYAADGAIDNIGDITAGAEGGAAWADSDADAMAIAYGLVTDNGGAYNDGDVMVTALGGTAETGNGAYADGSATGLSINGDLSNTGYLDVASGGGTATTNGLGNVAQAFAQSFAGGIEAQGTVDNSGAIYAEATGGIAAANKGISDYDDAAFAYAIVDGIFAAAGVYNSGSILADALGGTADANDNASVWASARGIRTSGPLDNYGSLHVIAAGGTATGWADTGSYAGADAEAWGLSGYELNNFGSIRVAATGGTADSNGIANAVANAYGIRTGEAMYNGGTLNVEATGGAATTGAGIADANASAYGIEAGGDLINRGGILVTATGGTADGGPASTRVDARSIAYGIHSTSGLITNDGWIDVAATGGVANTSSHGFDTPIGYSYARTQANAEAYGIQTEGDVTNSGHIAVTATGGVARPNDADPDSDADSDASAYAFGIYTEGAVDNAGNIVATATAGEAGSNGHIFSSASADASATGIHARNGDVSNSGDILATARGSDSSIFSLAGATGIYLYGGNLNNTGRITAIGVGGAEGGRLDGEAFGIFAADGSVNNMGVINATATGRMANPGSSAVPTYTVAIARGICTPNIGNVNNSADITVTATGGTVDGGRAEDYAVADIAVLAEGIMADGQVENTGAMMVTAIVGTTGVDNAYATAGASAYGIEAEGQVNNTADITVTAAGGTAITPEDAVTGAYGISATGVNNSGDITVTTTAQEGFTSSAYGIYMDGSGNLTNTGVIRTAGDTAYELYVASGTTTLAGTYNVTLDGDPSRASLGVADGATLALNDATLTATAIFGETLWNTPYKLFETSGTGVVTGSFGAVRAANPNTTVTYYDQDSVESVDDAVALAYTPISSPALASATVEKQLVSQAADVVNHHMATILLQNILLPPSSGLLADAGSTAESLALARTASDEAAGLFVEPYYSLARQDADPLGYDARLWGFSAGYERYLENTLLGLHLGYGQGDIDYTGSGFSGNSEEQDVVTGGLCGLTRWDPWILHYGLTGFYGSHDYEGRTGLSLEERETASFHSYGTAATLMAGPMFRCGPHVFLPEVGFNWLWVHRPRYTTEATNPSWDTTFSTLDDHDVYAAAALHWLSSFMHDDVRVTPSAALGIRYLLTDAEAGTWQSVPGVAPVLVRSEQDRTALTLSGALTLTRAPHAFSLAYDGDYSPDVQRHSLWLRYTWLF
jgi:hypothetical protein